MTAALLTLLLAVQATVPSLPVPAAQPPVTVILETTLGAIVIEVDAARAPATAANFLRYVDEGWYAGGRFTRTVRPDTETNVTHPIQVIQGGRRPAARGQGPAYPPVILERTRETGLRHVDGAVSMARVTGQPDSGRADFFICIGDQPALDFGGGRNEDGQGFAVFGRVVAGMDVVRRIQAAPVRPDSQTLQPPIPITAARRQ